MVAWVCGAGLLLPQIGLAEPALAGIGKGAAQIAPTKGAAQSVPTEEGVIGQIDTVKSIIFVNDMAMSYSPLTLKVHVGGRTTGITALRANQRIRFTAVLRKPGSTLGTPKVIAEVWVN
jgi:hypothetical protein